MITLASNLDILRSCLLTSLATVFVARLRHTSAWQVGTFNLLSCRHLDSPWFVPVLRIHRIQVHQILFKRRGLFTLVLHPGILLNAEYLTSNTEILITIDRLARTWRRPRADQERVPGIRGPLTLGRQQTSCSSERFCTASPLQMSESRLFFPDFTVIRSEDPSSHTPGPRRLCDPRSKTFRLESSGSRRTMA